MSASRTVMSVSRTVMSVSRMEMSVSRMEMLMRNAMRKLAFSHKILFFLFFWC